VLYANQCCVQFTVGVSQHIKIKKEYIKIMIM